MQYLFARHFVRHHENRAIALASADQRETVTEYIQKPAVGIREVRGRSLQEARKVDSLSKELHRLERVVRTFDAELDEAPNLRALRGALSSAIDALQQLEERVVEALLEKTPEEVRS